MSNAETNPTDSHVEELLAEGITAAKAGDVEQARDLLRQVVEIDERNEKGWYWLASVVESDDEKRVCLGNVIVINPENERAKTLLDQLSNPAAYAARPKAARSGKQPKALKPDEKPASANPNMLRVVAGVGFLVVILCLVAFVFLGKGNEPPPLPTLAPTNTSDVAIAATQPATTAAVAVEVSPTTELTSTPTETPTEFIPPSLGPSWTPRPSSTPRVRVTSTPLAAPPPEVTGRMVVLSGGALAAGLSMPVGVFDLASKQIIPVTGSERGDYGILSADGQRLIYTRVSSTSSLLRLQLLNGGSPRDISALWSNKPPLADQRMPSLSGDGKILVFAALNKSENDSTSDIYYLPIDFSSPNLLPTLTLTPTEVPTLPDSPTITPTATVEKPVTVSLLKRLTEKDSGENSWPSISPDGSQVVYISDKQFITGGVDLFIIPLAGGQPTPLTNDGIQMVESAPEWSPDGQKIVFQLTPAGKNTSDIYLMDANGQNKMPLVEGGNNVRPHWSPDGRYVAFSSNRTGKWEIFVVDVATRVIYQITSGQDNIIVTEWVR